MIHARYKWRSPQEEIAVIRKENKIIEDVEFDNVDRAEVLESCD